MKIWVHIDGVQEGPFEPDQLPLDRMTGDTPVWYDGLPGWLPAAEAEVTAQILAQQQEQPSPDEQQVPSDDEQQTAPYDDSYVGYGQQFQPVFVQGPYQDPQMQGAPPERAPTYLIWSLLLTILCCNPVGIVPLILGAGVSSKLRAHNFEAAKRQSLTTEWWLIITIVTSLVMLPYTFLMFFL